MHGLASLRGVSSVSLYGGALASLQSKEVTPPGVALPVALARLAPAPSGPTTAPYSAPRSPVPHSGFEGASNTGTLPNQYSS